MPIYDDEPEEYFWLLYQFTDRDGTKYEKAKDMKFKIIASYVDAKIKEHEESKNGSN